MPEDFQGTFGQHVAESRKRIENQLRLDGETDEVALTEQAEAEAQFSEAHRWLVEHWGEQFPCPVCGNVQWTVSGLFHAPNGYLAFQVICRFCANTMSAVPAYADLEAPVLGEQLPLSGPDQ
jgi:hypothetical protein